MTWGTFRCRSSSFSATFATSAVRDSSSLVRPAGGGLAEEGQNILRDVFGNTWLNSNEWLAAILLSLLLFTAVEVWTFIRRTLSSATVT